MKKSLPFILISVVLLADQILKTWVKTNMVLRQEFEVFGNWFLIHFLENDGMAFGLEFPGDMGKPILTIFRIAVVIVLIYYLQKLSKEEAKTIVIVSLSLITAGALGNIIDSVFYGVIYSDMNHYPGGWFQGQVVDMFYFPLFSGTLPEWIPFKGGDYFEFFRPVFNIADSAISTGVALIILFQRHFFKSDDKIVEVTESEINSL